MSSSNIKVIIRARPLPPDSTDTQSWVINDNKHIYQRDKDNAEIYSYDEVFDVDKTNCDIYKTAISPMVRSAIEGINLTIFAYGATSSGKTYTMNGTQEDPGVIPRIVEDIFEQIQMCNKRQYSLRVSYVEIYSEVINDLLDKNNKDLKIREDVHSCVSYKPTEMIIKSSQECLAIMKIGTANRTTAETQMNIFSSRSHSIFRIVIESTMDSGSDQVSHVNLIDLAGSERVSQTGTTGQRFKEGAHINKSLTVLGLVMRQLVEKRDYINFRDSKLTRILSNSLGGNAKTIIIGNINLGCKSVEDTASTLMFAQRAKSIKNKPKVNELLPESSLIQKHSKECSELKKLLDAELVKNKNLQEEREMSTNKVKELAARIQSLQEIFVTRGPVKRPPKRRHTFCSALNSISEERELESFSRNPLLEEDYSIESAQTDEPLEALPKIQCNENSSSSTPESIARRSQIETPVKHLRERLRCLTRDYEELLDFTRLEKEVERSTEQSMATKIRELTEECEGLSRKQTYTEKKIEQLTSEKKQMQNDYECMMEIQKKKFEKREKELLEMNECLSAKPSASSNLRDSVILPRLQISPFEYEEMFETMESLKKQNEELQKVNEDVISQNSELQTKFKSFQSENIDLFNKVSALELQNSQLQTKNKSLQDKCSQKDVDLLESKKSTTDINSLKIQISELQKKVEELQSELLCVKNELYESQDKLIEVTEDLDKEEKKSLELQRQLGTEKELREEVESKLRENEQQENTFRFSTDSSLYQRCKSLDKDVLQILYELQAILDPQKEISPVTSSITKNEKSSMEDSVIYGSESASESKQDILGIGLDKLELFSKGYFKDADKTEEFLKFFHSIVGKINSPDIIRTEGSSQIRLDSVLKQHEIDLANEIEKLKNKISSMKAEKDSDAIAIGKLEKQLEEYRNRNSQSSQQEIDLLNEIEKLKKEISSVKSEREHDAITISTLEIQLKECLNRNSLLNQQKIDLLNETDALKIETSSIKAERDSAAKTIRNLENQLEEYLDRNSKLDQHEIDLLQQIEKLKTEMNSMKAERDSDASSMKAERYSDNITIGKLKNQLEESHKRNSQLNQHEIDLLNEIEQLKKEISAMKSERYSDAISIEKLESQLKECLNRNSLLNQQKSDLLNEIESLKIETSSIKAQRDSAAITIGNLEKQLKEYLHRNSQFNQHNSDLLNEIEKLKNEISSVKAEKDSGAITILKLKSELQEYYNRNKQLNKRETGLLNDIEKLKNEISSINAEKDSGAIRIVDLEKQLEKYLIRNAQLSQHEIEHLNEIQTLKNEINAMRTEKESDALTIEKLKNLVEEYLERNSQIRSDSEIDHLNGIEEMKDEITSIKEEIDSDAVQIIKLESQLKEYVDRTSHLNHHKVDLLNEIEKLNNEISCMKAEKDADVIRIVELERQLEEYLNRNLSDTEKIKKSNKNSSKIMNDSELLEAINRLKCVLEKRKNRKFGLRQGMRKHISNPQTKTACEEMELIIDEVASLIQELDKKNDEYTTLKQISDKISRENKVRIATLQFKCDESEKKLENFAFENQNLAEKLSHLEKKNRQYQRDALKAIENIGDTSHTSGFEANTDSEISCSYRKEDKWKQQRTQAHDSRRSIDLNTLCSETTVETCLNCEHMNHQLQKMKSEISQLRRQTEDLMGCSSELEILKIKYDKMKKLCIIRNEEIKELKQSK